MFGFGVFSCLLTIFPARGGAGTNSSFEINLLVNVTNDPATAEDEARLLREHAAAGRGEAWAGQPYKLINYTIQGYTFCIYKLATYKRVCNVSRMFYDNINHVLDRRHVDLV